MIKKAVEDKAKAGLQHASYIREISHQALRGNYAAHVTATKVQNQGIAMRDFRIEKPKSKAQDPKLANDSSNLKKRPKRGFEKRSANKGTPALVSLLPGVIQPLTKQGLEAQKKTSLISCVITITKKGTIPGPVPNLRKTTLQKTSNSFENLHVGD